MEKDKNKQEEPNRRRELIHAYSKQTMDNDKEQTEQDETDTHLRTSMEEEQEPLTWEEYGKEEPLEGYDKDEPFEENDDEGKWATEFSYPTEEEENALFIAFMTGNVEDQKTWINAKMNLTRTTTNEETRRREEEILDRIIPTGIVDLDEAFEEEDEEETDDLFECQPYDLTEDQEEDFTDEFIDKDKEDEDIQPLESLTVSYRNHEKQDEETVNSSSLTTEPNEQLDKARYFTELDVRWKHDDRHTEDEDQCKINFETNQKLFKPMVILSRLYSPTTSQVKTDEIFRDQKDEHQTIVNMNYDIQTKGQDTEYTRCAQRQSRDNDLFAEQEGCTTWVAKTKYEGLLYPENQLQMNRKKLYGIDIWPTPAMTTKVKSFLRFGNVDKGFIQDNWTLTEPLENLFEKDEIFLDKKNNQDDEDEIMSPVGSFSQLLDPECSNERTLENDDEQSDPIKSLSVHGLKTLRNHHFSKVTAATSVNDVIAVNVTNMDPRKRITMARIVNYMINSLSGKGPNILEDIFEDWLIWTPQLPNKNTALTNHSTLRHFKPIQILNGKQARQSLFLLEQPDRYMTENADNQNDILLPSKTTIKTVEEKNVFDTPTKGILLPWNLQRENNLWFYIEAFSIGIPPGPLLMDLLKSLGVGTVVEDHGSTEGVISRIPGISEPYKGETTTIPLGTLKKQNELSDKSTPNLRLQSMSHKLERSSEFESTRNTTHHPEKNGITERINSEIWKLFFQISEYNKKPRITHKLAQRISKQETFSEESKQPSIFRNHRPEFLNNWRIHPVIHTSLPPSYEEKKNLPILPNEKVAPLENTIRNKKGIYRSGNRFHQENRLILTRHLPSAFLILPNYLPVIQPLTRSYWHPCQNHDSLT